MTHTITIGVLSPVTGGSYYGKVLAGIAREVAAVGGQVVLVQTLDAGLSNDEVILAPDFESRTAWDHIDGVISIATATKRQHLDRLRLAGKPVALASDVIVGLAVPSAMPDNAGGVHASVAHLIEHGHRRIAFAANLTQPDMRARYHAYGSAMRNKGIEPDPKWFYPAFDNGERGGRDVAEQLVAGAMPVTALILATDRNAIGCIERLTDLGVTIPDDLAIVGFDGLEAGSYTQPTLSTVRQGHDEIGASAARLVLAQLRGEKVEPRVHPSPSTFVPRGSCGCAGDDVSVDGDGGLAFWRDEARMRFARSTNRETSMREQYEIGRQLLDHEHTDPRQLEWLSATNVRGALLALWDGDPAAGVLRIAGVHDPDGVLQDAMGLTCRVEQFPPRSLIALADPGANEVTIVVPVKARSLDFGLLAVVAEVDSLSANGRETHNQWAALLTATLDQQSLAESVRVSEQRYGLWAVATNDGLWDWDLESGSVYYSGRCMELLGQQPVATTGGPSTWFDAVHPDDVDRVRDLMAAPALGRLEPIEFEHRVRFPDGTYRCLWCRALPVGSPGDAATRIVGSIQDIEPRKQLEEQLRQGALYDEVTGLPNRKMFLESLCASIEAAAHPPRTRYAVVFLDLDGFKLVNDSLGHLVGDQLLAHIGQRLRYGLRPTDLAARFGGDEFAVLLHNVGPDELQAIVERLQLSLGAPMVLDGHEVAVTASVGITTSDGDYVTAEDVLRDADIAMYHAKARRRGSYSMFDIEMRATAITRLEVQSELRQALERGEFEVHYQPLADLDGRGTDHFEALVRWHHPQRGLVGPSDFLADMEEAGLVVPLGHWVIDDVGRQIAAWRRTYCGALNVSINLSNREFVDAGLIPHIRACIERHGIAAEHLTLEITEGIITRSPESARTTLEGLHAIGIRVQIDNFGTSTSSLHALRCLPVQALKIDRSFIRDLDVDARTTKLVEIIIAMGRAIGIDVIAEGVETAAQLNLLREMGCHSAQGFWFTEAVDAAGAAGMLGRSLPI